MLIWGSVLQTLGVVFFTLPEPYLAWFHSQPLPLYTCNGGIFITCSSIGTDTLSSSKVETVDCFSWFHCWSSGPVNVKDTKSGPTSGCPNCIYQNNRVLILLKKCKYFFLINLQCWERSCFFIYFGTQNIIWQTFTKLYCIGSCTWQEANKQEKVCLVYCMGKNVTLTARG